MDIPFVSVIIPVRNEGLILRQCLQSLVQLDYPRDRIEIIIADGKSTDNTAAVAREFGCVVVTNERKLVGSGRNIGFQHSQGEFVAFTDADCLFDPHWLKKGVAHFSDPCIGGVGGKTLTPSHGSNFEKAVDFLFRGADAVSSTSHRQRDEKTHTVRDLPGCNCIYRREALRQVMPVDENLLTAEDVWMNYCLRDRGALLLYDPQVIVWHHRRNSPKRFLRQMYRFAIGRLQVAKKSSQLINVFHVLAAFSIPLLALLVWEAIRVGALVFFVCASAGVVCFMMAMALFQYRSFSVAGYVPVMLVLFCIGWSAGFLREFFIPMRDAQGK